MKNIKTPVGSLTDTKEKVTKYAVTVNDITRSIKVREVENGFVVEIHEDGYNGSGKNKDWYSARQTYISETNPIKDTKVEEAGMAKFMKSAVENLKL